MESLPHPTFDRRLNRAFAAMFGVGLAGFTVMFVLGDEPWTGWARSAAFLISAVSWVYLSRFFRDSTSCPRCVATLTRPDFAPAFVCRPCGVEWVTRWQFGG